MNRLREIAERLAEVDSTLRALHADIGERSATARQQERWDSLESERDELVTERNQLEARMDRIRRVAENPENTEHGDDRSGRRRPELAPGEGQVVGEALRAIERAVGVPDHAKQAATALVESERSHPGLGVSLAARWALAAADPDYESAWLSQLIDPERGHLSWSEAQRSAWARAELVQRAMSVGTAASGGHMVPLTLDPALVLTSAGAAGNPVRAAARKVTTVTNEWRGVTTAGVSASWDAEAAEVSDDSPTLAQPAIPVHKLAIFVPYSIEAEMDIPGLVDELRAVMQDERDVAEALAFTTGSGVAQPKGFVTALDGTASEVAPTTVETFTVADIYKTIEALPPRHRPNAAWMSNLAVANDIRQFDSTGGTDLWA
ncbi:MAG: phage major capsid protein, partial [Acidimicrobiales bacterium]|nr:phage major capsid protein [Acidimicrobiales bacterium]